MVSERSTFELSSHAFISISKLLPKTDFFRGGRDLKADLLEALLWTTVLNDHTEFKLTKASFFMRMPRK